MVNFLPENIENLSHAYLLEGDKAEYFKTLQMYFKETLDIENLFNYIDCTVLSCQGLKVEKVRDMLKNILIQPYFEKKIYILTDFHEASVYVQNALLKSLEEPPGYAVFFLIADHVQQILSTIISRCISIYEVPLKNQDVASDMETLIHQTSFRSMSGTIGVGNLTREELLEKLLDHQNQVYLQLKASILANRKDEVKKALKISEAIETAQRRIKANCSMKSVIDAMVFQVMEAKND